MSRGDKSALQRYFISGPCLIIFFLFSVLHAGELPRISVGRFSDQELGVWQAKAFYNKTHYSISMLGDKSVLKAVSDNAASGIIRKIRVDLNKTPFLNWRWRVEEPLSGIYDEKTKTGDDYAARIYVVVSGGIAIWKTRALNYVWAKYSPKGAVWPNAFAGGSAIMLAVRSSEDNISDWYSEKRNIQMDFKQVFGKSIHFIDAVVIMSDTDNTQNKAVAYYGDIYFSAE